VCARVQITPMHITVISSCTGQKASTSPDQLTRKDFAAGEDHVVHRTKALEELTRPAERMYIGQHHLRLMRGVRAVRELEFATLDARIISAGYGLIPADKEIAPYDCTFSGMGKAELRRWANVLSIPSDARAILERPCDLGIVLLSNDYLAACQLPPDLELGGPTLFFSSYSAARELQQIPRARAVPLGNAEASRFSRPLVSLKGELGGRVLSLLAAADGDDHAHSLIGHLLNPATDVYNMLEQRSVDSLV